MGRPRRGTLKRRPTKQGISYGVAFTYRGEEFYEHFGGEWEGWDEERAAEEQRFLMEKVNRGEWTSAKAESTRGFATAAAPTFQVEASQWLHRRKVRAGDLEGRTKTMRDLEWRLSVVMDKSAPRPSTSWILASPTSWSSNYARRGRRSSGPQPRGSR